MKQVSSPHAVLRSHGATRMREAPETSKAGNGTFKRTEPVKRARSFKRSVCIRQAEYTAAVAATSGAGLNALHSSRVATICGIWIKSPLVIIFIY